jgi:agmatine deiminase
MILLVKTLKTNPRLDGFRMPAEYCLHQATFMLWPFRSDVWRNNGQPAQKVFLEVGQAIAKFELVYMGVQKTLYKEISQKYQIPNLHFFPIDSNDAWMRDVGPTMLINDHGDIRGIDWKFNAWGGSFNGLYSDWKDDDLVANVVLHRFNYDSYRTSDFVLEGGSIHVDGAGLALVTEACLLSKGRNPNMSKIQIEEKLKSFLNVEKVIWLPRGIYNDETSEHVDNIACFVGPGHVLIATADNKDDPQYDLSKASFDVLVQSTDLNNKPIKITKMVLPEPLYSTIEESLSLKKSSTSKPRPAQQRLAASYVNFYFCNNAIIMPIFHQPSDEIARSILQSLFPQRKIIPIYSREILLGGGNIHCITQQLPKGV